MEKCHHPFIHHPFLPIPFCLLVWGAPFFVIAPSQPIKIEAGFYSSNLVRYLVYGLNVPISNIKYKIITKKALKPHTFSSFIKCIFDTFPEKQAKQFANSFIGELGRKYHKKNNVFTTTSYASAMNCWTRGLSKNLNISIDKYNDLYLVREQHCRKILSDNTPINRFVPLPPPKPESMGKNGW